MLEMLAEQMNIKLYLISQATCQSMLAHAFISKQSEIINISLFNESAIKLYNMLQQIVLLSNNTVI